jgi:hypothetical protein
MLLREVMFHQPRSSVMLIIVPEEDLIQQCLVCFVKLPFTWNVSLGQLGSARIIRKAESMHRPRKKGKVQEGSR